LGGTTATIPKLVLNLVGRTPVAGTTRTEPLINSSDVSANMLQAAKAACFALYYSVGFATPDVKAANRFGIAYDFYPLIQTNGDEELWEQLCSINNPPFVRGLTVGSGGGNVTFSFGTLYESTAYPANTPVGKQGGQVAMSSPSGGVTDDNHAPWCIVPPNPTNPKQMADVATFLAANTINGQPLPLCPAALVPTEVGHDPNVTITDRLNTFALRGAINAGFAVFEYLDQVSKGQANTELFDECTSVPPSP
jgi:hypothetical protein